MWKKFLKLITLRNLTNNKIMIFKHNTSKYMWVLNAFGTGNLSLFTKG